jgi:hypothetical protein
MPVPSTGRSRPSLEPRITELSRLRQAYRLALERYIDVSSASSGRLLRLTPESISELDKANLQVTGRREAAAHETYLAAKTALLDYLIRSPARSYENTR